MEKRRRVQIELASLRRRLAYATKFIEEVKHDCYSKKIGSMAEQVLVKLKKGEC